MVKSSFQSDEDQQMQKIVAQEAKVSSLAILSDAKIQQDTSTDVLAVRTLLQELEKPINRIVDQATVYAKTLEKNQYREVLSWLSQIPFVRHHARHSESRIPGSGEWLLDHPQYLSWKNSSNSLILLLHGIKGSGKTSLASAVVDSFLKENSKQTSPAPTAYFYCAKNASELERADPDEIMRSIVRQLTLTSLTQRLVCVQEFLETQPNLATHHIHRLAAMSCLSMCMQGSPVGREVDLRPKEKFYHYSALYWAEHYKAAAIVGTNDNLFQMMKEFVFDNDEISLSFIDWLDDAQEFSRALANNHHPLKKALSAVTNSDHTPLFAACVFELTNLLDVITQAPDFDWNQKNDIGQTGLYLASAIGYENIVSLFLDHGANVDASGGRHDSALHAACFAGHTAIVQLLLEHNANPNRRGRFDNALQASLLGDKEEVALLVLRNGFGISNQNDYDAILQQAAQAGHIDVAQLIQTRYASSFGDSGSAQYKAVEAAIVKGRLGVLERLFWKSPNSKQHLPSDAVSTAALGGQDQMVALLLDRGSDIEREGPFGTPLRAASLMGHESVVRILLGRGAKVSACSTLGDALQAAAMKGHVSITKLLIQEGADANSRGGYHGNALQAAAYRGHKGTVEILLDSGADVHQQGLSRDAFHAAAEGGHEGIVHLFLKRGFKFFDIQIRPQYARLNPSPYKDLIRDASPSRAKESRHDQSRSQDWQNHASAADLHHLLGASRYLEVTGGDGDAELYQRKVHRSDEENYALQAAASKGRNSVVRLILDHWDMLNITSTEVRIALNEASKNGHEDVVRLFTTSKLDMMPHLVWALEGAASHGHLAIVDMLLAYEQASKLEDDRKPPALKPTERAWPSFNPLSDQACYSFSLW